MKYKKQIVFLIVLNFIIVFSSIFVGNLTRKLELANYEVNAEIQKQKEQLAINKIEFSSPPKVEVF